MKTLYPSSHPYHWPVIGWMEDLDAATLEDVKRFFATYYAPNNASLAIAGAVEAERVIDLVEKYFGEVMSSSPALAITAAQPRAQFDEYVTLEDEVHLPRLYMGWHTPPLLADGDAEMDVVADVLGSGKAARLYTRLVHELQIAQDVEAYQDSGILGSSLQLCITAREDVPLQHIEDETRKIIQSLARDLTQRELERGRNHIETATIDALQSVGGFGGKADRLNHYLFYANNSDYIAQDLARYSALTVESVRDRLKRTIEAPAVIISVVPDGKTALAAGGGT
jgi:zinc protease